MSTSSPHFIVIGSSGGGGTIAWLLAKAGHRVTILEAGKDLASQEFSKPPRAGDPPGFNSTPHDEYRYRLERPDFKRRLSGDYNTFRRHKGETARPTRNGWTGTTLGGGSTIWGTWAFRALPADFKLATTFEKLGTAESLKEWGYEVADWPIDYNSMEPFYNAAEALLAVSGDRSGWEAGIRSSAWFAAIKDQPQLAGQAWWPRVEYPCPAYPRTPVGLVVERGMAAAGMHPVSLPSAIVNPSSDRYSTRDKLAAVLADLRAGSEFWKKAPEELWSERVRQACQLCGFCGEFLCFGGAREVDGLSQRPGAPKSGAHSTVLKELADLPNATVHCNARAYEVIYDAKARRATGVRWLDLTDEEEPQPKELHSDFVIISCGSVQSARLLWMSGGSRGLGNKYDQLGRNTTWHLFGMSAKAEFLADKFKDMLRGEFGHTGNVTSFDHYFVQSKTGVWLKGGTLTSAAKKNPLENAVEKTESKPLSEVHREVIKYNLTTEVRLTGDDLPMPANRVDLDPSHVDEYGFPVARITRQVGTHEWLMYEAMKDKMTSIFKLYGDNKLLTAPPSATPHVHDLLGDHQMGSCRMGNDPKTSVVDRMCRLHEAKNCFVVDSSFMPTGLGLNPMVTVVANALRVGTFIADSLTKGGNPAKD